MISNESPNDTPRTKQMRKDLARIKDMIAKFESTQPGGKVAALTEENAILRELLTSWQAVTAYEFQTDDRLHLNILTKRMLCG